MAACLLMFMKSMLSLSVFCLIICCFLFLDETLGFLNVEELQQIAYTVEISDEPICGDENLEYDFVDLGSKFGQSYRCRFDAGVLSNYIASKENRSDNSKNVVNLLSNLTKSDCLIKTVDWWTYEFCYGKDIKQYHLVNGRLVGNIIIMGKYSSDFNWSSETANESDEYSQRYHSQLYVNGTICDLTGFRRSTIVRFVCSEIVTTSYDTIESVTEPSSCNYILTIHTQRLCAVSFLKNKNIKHRSQISCHPLLTGNEYDNFLAANLLDSIKTEEKKYLVENIITDNAENIETKLFTRLSTAKDENDLFKKYVVNSLISGLQEDKTDAEDLSDTEIRLVRDNSMQDNEAENNPVTVIEKLSVDTKSVTPPSDGSTPFNTHSDIIDYTFDKSTVVIKDEESDPTHKEESKTDTNHQVLESNIDGSVVDGSAVSLEQSTKFDGDLSQTFLTPAESSGQVNSGTHQFSGEVLVDDKLNEADIFPLQDHRRENPLNDRDIESNVVVVDKDSEKIEHGREERSALEGQDSIETISIEYIKKDIDTESVHTEAGESYATWQGEGRNKIQRITINDNGGFQVSMRSRDDEMKEDPVDKEVERGALDWVDVEPTKKREVVVINSDFYDINGRPVARKKRDGTKEDVFTIFRQNDKEIEEHFRHKKLQENYSLKWKNGKLDKMGS